MKQGSETPDTQTRRPRLGLVCSHGGHLTEMLQLSEAFAGCDTFYFCYDADTTRRLPNAYLVPNKPYSPVRFVLNLVKLIGIFRRERPDCIVSTGAEIAIPAFVVAWLFRVPRLYIECGAQVTQPSLTGKVLARVATSFFVQWPELLEAYGPRARYCGSLIDETDPEATVR